MKHKLKFIENLFSLYSVQALLIISPLIQVPYLSRILGSSIFGKVIFAQALASWLSIVVTYGYNYSGPRDIAKIRKSTEVLRSRVVNIIFGQLILVIPIILIFLIFIIADTSFRRDIVFNMGGLFLAVANGLSPVWYYQGIENLRVYTILQFIAQVVILILLFAIVKNPNDGHYVLYIKSFVIITTVIINYYFIFRFIGFEFPTIKKIIISFKRGWSMFLFQSSASVYTTANNLIVGLIGTSSAVAFFGSAEKISKSFMIFFTPISQLMLPKISSLVKTDKHKAKKYATLSFWSIIIISTFIILLVYLLGSEIIYLLLGDGYQEAIPLLKILIFLIPLIGISNVFGVQWMIPNKMDLVFNKIIISAGLLSLIISPVSMYLFGVVGLCWAILVTETYVVVLMIYNTQLSDRGFFVSISFSEVKNYILKMIKI